MPNKVRQDASRSLEYLFINILGGCADTPSFFVMSDRAYLQRLIKEGEHQQQDFKYKITDACKLAKSVSAFANTKGGRLLIGVRDDGHLSGVRSEEEIFMMRSAATDYCRPAVDLSFQTFLMRMFVRSGVW